MPEVEVEIAPYGVDPKTGKAFPPNPTQLKILEWVDRIRSLDPEDRDHIFVLYIQGGVGSGKSRGIMAPVIELLLEIPNIRVLWGRQDFKDIKMSIMDKFFEVLPKELIANKNEQYHYYDLAQNDDKVGRIYFNGLKDIGGLGSQEFAAIAVTEAHEITEQSYRALKRRCRQANAINIILMESEAPNESHWLQNITDPSHESYDRDIEMWQLDTRENWHNLPVSYTGSLESMPESWKKKYLRGSFGFIPDGTPFYTGFKEDLHKREIIVNTHKPLILGWDYGFRHPSCVITQIDAKGRWCFLREIIGTDITIKNFGNVIKEFLNVEFPGFEHKSYGDPAGSQKSDKNEFTSEEILDSIGFKVTTKSSTYRERKEIIERLLGTMIDGIPSLIVDSRCKIIVDGFLGGYHYPQVKPGAPVTDHKAEIPYEDGFYEHPMNAMEYIAVNTNTPVKQTGEKEKEAKRRAIVHERNVKKKNAGIGYGKK